MTTIPEGPWTHEPDYEQWADPQTGLLCLIRRGPTGHLRGYVAVPENHPWHEVDAWNLDVDVHGGISWADRGNPDIRRREDPARWWIGFAANQRGDLIPLLRDLGLSRGDVYRDIEFMRAETTKLAALAAKQLAAPAGVDQ